ETQQNKEIKKYNDLLDAIKASIKQYEDILGRPYEPQMTAKPVEKPAPMKAPAPNPMPPVEPKVVPPPPPAPKATASPARVAKDKEEDTLKTKDMTEPDTGAQPFPPAPPPVRAAPPSDVGFEAQLSDELDMFLEAEGDYFSEEPQGAPPVVPEALRKPE